MALQQQEGEVLSDGPVNEDVYVEDQRSTRGEV